MEKDVREVFAERLKELREEKGLTFQQLEKETGISNASLCRWENCKVDAKMYQLVKLAEYFGVTTDYLLGLEN